MFKNKRIMETEGYSPEMKLLQLCCRKDITDSQKDTIEEILSHKVNWEIFIKKVMKNRVYPVVYKNLSEIKNSDINAKSLEILERKSRKNIINSVKQTGELIRLFNRFDNLDIRAISIKGPLLGLDIYGDLALRTSKDLDILVSEEDLDLVGSLLCSEGYKQVEYEQTPKQRKILLKTSHHFSFVHNNGVTIELHWRYYSQGYKIQFNDVWDRRSSVELSGNHLSILCSEENLLYLVFHGSRHGWTRLRWLCDVSEILKKNELQWLSVIKRAEHLDILYMLVQAVILAHEFFDTKIPEELTILVKNDKLGNKLAMMALPLITITEENAIARGKSLYSHYKKYLIVWHRSLSQKVIFVMGHFYPRVLDYQAIHFQDKYFFMYFLLGPFLKIRRSLQKFDQ